MIYVVETFRLSEEARADPSFAEWLRGFNTLVEERNPTVQSIDVYSAYTGGFEMEGWFGMEDFSALEQSAEAEREMFKGPEIMGEWKKFAAYIKPASRRIMYPVA